MDVVCCSCQAVKVWGMLGGGVPNTNTHTHTTSDSGVCPKLTTYIGHSLTPLFGSLLPLPSLTHTHTLRCHLSWSAFVMAWKSVSYTLLLSYLFASVECFVVLEIDWHLYRIIIPRKDKLLNWGGGTFSLCIWKEIVQIHSSEIKSSVHRPIWQREENIAKSIMEVVRYWL